MTNGRPGATRYWPQILTIGVLVLTGVVAYIIISPS
ncbi:MAG: hypothetical protein JWQ64_2970 [Subtercola sp.]|jgi:hypothetical protein|nr:hypothetical protein [Subtercola sp.]